LDASRKSPARSVDEIKFRDERIVEVVLPAMTIMLAESMAMAMPESFPLPPIYAEPIKPPPAAKAVTNASLLPEFLARRQLLVLKLFVPSTGMEPMTTGKFVDEAVPTT
jgi:hypothetical protein